MNLRIVFTHIAAVILSVVFGWLMISPFMAFQSALGSSYQGIQRPIQDDELFYLSLIKEAVEGHGFVTNPYFWEQKRNIPQQPFVAQFLLAQPLRLFQLNVLQGRLLYNVLFGILICGLTYGIAYRIAGSRIEALLATGVLLFGLFTFVFLRPVSPQFNFFFWLSGFLLLYLVATRPARLWRTVLCALNLGFLFYVYPYYWTQEAALVAIFVAAIWWRDRRLAFQYFLILVGAGVLAIPYIYMTWRASHAPGYLDTLSRIGSIASHAPGAILIVVLSSVALFGLFLGVRLKKLSVDAEFFFFVSVLLSGIIASNQEILTGRIFQYSMHYHMQVVFGIVFCALYVLRRCVPSFSYRVGITSVVFILMAVGLADGHGIGMYLAQAREIRADDRQIQWYAPAFDWLREHATADDVVYANGLASELLPVYTNTNVLFADSASNLTVLDSDYEDRYILNHYFESFTPEFIREHQRSLFCARYLNLASQKRQQDQVRRLFGLPVTTEPLVPDDVVAHIQERAHQIQSVPLLEGLRPYRVNYVLWDKDRDPKWAFDGNPAFVKKFETSTIVIYQIATSSKL